MAAVPLLLAVVIVVDLYRYISANLRREFEAVSDDEQDVKDIAERQRNLTINNELERLWREGAEWGYDQRATP